jgi:hypothetical protein
MRKVFALAILLASLPAIAQSRSPFTLLLAPSAQLPLGSEMRGLYGLGYGAELDGDLSLPGGLPLAARASLGYAGIPIAETQDSLTIFSLGLGPCLVAKPIERLDLRIAAQGGYALLVGPGGLAGNPFASAGLSASFSFSSSFSLGLGAAYRAHFNTTGLDYQGIGLRLGASIGLGGGPAKSLIRILDVHFDPIFPVFFKYYDTSPAGSLRIENGERGPIDDVRVSFLVPQYMAGPKECAVFERLKRGESREVPILALFSDSIVGITEDTKVTAKIGVEYDYMGSRISATEEVSLRVYNRNAMTWDDDRRAAAFVSAKDPTVLTFAKTAAAVARERGGAVDTEFRQAMGIFQALGTYGLRYVPDPTSPFTDAGKGRSAIDYLQFPAQTLAYKAGDCDDLSICYAAMLEATGTPSALVTVPGHILVAFDLGMDLAEARASFSTPGDLIFRDGRAWVPVEVTMLRDGFLAAWRTGAREWNEAGSKAALLPVREAWGTYEAAAFVGGEQTQPFPSAEAVAKTFDGEFGRFVAAEIKDREIAYRADISQAQKDPKPRNRLGVLYARYGLWDKAEAEFAAAAAAGYAPAMVNLGNVALERRDAEKAADWFARAYAKDGTSVPAIVGLARARYAAGAAAEAKTLHAKLQALDPKTAQRYAYLGSGGATAAGGAAGRAAEAGAGQALWAESE